MSDKLFLELASPQSLVLSLEVDEVLATGTLGEFGVLPGHASFLSSLKPGEFRFRSGTKEECYLISDGFFQVADDKVIVLTESCEKLTEIDVNEATRIKEELENYLENNKDILDTELKRLEMALDYQNKRIELGSKK